MAKILIAEDEKDLRDLYKMRFELESFETIFAKDGEEALEKVKKEKPDVMLLDIMMPKKSGMEVLEELKKDSSTKDMPVVVLTALPNKKLEEEATSLNASYLVKSQVIPTDVVKIVKEKLNMK